MITAEFPRRALVSVSDKSDLGPFVKGLVALGFEIVSTGGTRKFLLGEGIPVIDISEYTGFPEMMDGRVKTLHPKVHGGLLGRRENKGDVQSMNEHGILPFELVVCNLYPFEETVAKEGCTVEEAIENIDIGGPSMIRSASKNHMYVTVITNPKQYNPVLVALKSGSVSDMMRRELAAAAFAMTAKYERAIADYMQTRWSPSRTEMFPEKLHLNFDLKQITRYGENPHQKGAFYVESTVLPGSLAAAQQINGKDLSYNNLLDLDAALALVREFVEPTAVVLKHNNPCGAATRGKISDAFCDAWDGDPLSAFGSVLGFNREVDAEVANMMCEGDRFVEAMIAPSYSEEAFKILTTVPKWKANVRLLTCSGMEKNRGPYLDYRRVSGGLLVQQGDTDPPMEDFRVVTTRHWSLPEYDDLHFAWLICKHVKSNAIVFAKDRKLVGVGAGQMSRVDSFMIAAHKSKERSVGAVVGSDAFIPFRDGVDLAAKAGITAIIQPGGSKRDDEVIVACNEHKIAMLFTGRRHFKH